MYIRGLAYLESGDGRSAAGEFQKLIDNPGLCLRFVTSPLARLQLGLAQKMTGDEAAARQSYETFLDLWKDADPDVPIYQQAKVAYAQLKKTLTIKCDDYGTVNSLMRSHPTKQPARRPRFAALLEKLNLPT